MEYTLEQVGTACVVRFLGDLSGPADGEVKKLFVRMRDANDVRLVADMRQVEFLDSNVLGTLVWALKNMREAGGDLRLFGLRDFVERLFDITRLNQAFQIFASESEALASFPLST